MTTDIIRVIFLLPACGLLGFAILRDIAARIIPNALCAGVATLALALHVARGDWMAALLAGALVFVIAYVCWTRGWLGGGDVKLLSATAMLVPPGNVPALLGAIAVAGGALAACYLVLARIVAAPRGRGASAAIAAHFARRTLAHPRRPIPAVRLRDCRRRLHYSAERIA